MYDILNVYIFLLIVSFIKRNEGKRDITDYMMNQIGLQKVIDALKSSSANVTAQFQLVLLQQVSQLLFASQEVAAKSKIVLENLILDLHNHTGNAVDIVHKAIENLNHALIENISQKGNVTKLVEAILKQFKYVNIKKIHK